MSRMRFCSAKGVMEFSTKSGTSSPPKGLMPWFDVPDRKTRNVNLVCGHWSALGLHVRNDVCVLDTGCVWGGQLTALCLDDRTIQQVSCRDLPGTQPIE